MLDVLCGTRGLTTTPAIRRLAAVALVAVLTCPADASVPGHIRDNYTAALVMDARSGEVLFADRARDPVIPASLVKMMVLLIGMEHIESGELSLDERYEVTAAASLIGGHQVYLKQGEVFELGDLLKAVMVFSANDAAYAVAEHIAGSQSAFVDLMNERARTLGMDDTHFTNVHGLPPGPSGKADNRTTARDLSVLARALMRYPVVLNWSSTRLDWFRDGTFQLLNTNHRFLHRFAGADGLKTGYHSRGAGHCVVGTALRGGRRLLAVIMGADAGRERLRALTTLLDRGFEGRL